MEAVAAEVGWMNRERRRARGQVMALLARDLHLALGTGNEEFEHARILEYYRYSAYGTATVLPAHDDGTEYGLVDSGVFSGSGQDDGSGSHHAWDGVEDTPLSLDDNNDLMKHRRNGTTHSGGNIPTSRDYSVPGARGESYGRVSQFGNHFAFKSFRSFAEVGLLGTVDALFESWTGMAIKWPRARKTNKTCEECCKIILPTSEITQADANAYGRIYNACVEKCERENWSGKCEKQSQTGGETGGTGGGAGGGGGGGGDERGRKRADEYLSKLRTSESAVAALASCDQTFSIPQAVRTILDSAFALSVTRGGEVGGHIALSSGNYSGYGQVLGNQDSVDLASTINANDKPTASVHWGSYHTHPQHSSFSAPDIGYIVKREGRVKHHFVEDGYCTSVIVVSGRPDPSCEKNYVDWHKQGGTHSGALGQPSGHLGTLAVAMQPSCKMCYYRACGNRSVGDLQK